MTVPLRAMPDRYDVYRVFTDLESLHEALRDRVEDLNVSRIELDAVAGLTPGYSAKLLCDPPMKFLGLKALPKMLKGTGLKIALIEDNGQAIPELPRRKYRIGRIEAAAAQSITSETQVSPINIEELLKQAMSERTKQMRKSDSSAKRQARRQKQRARQRRASHAARKRWSKK